MVEIDEFDRGAEKLLEDEAEASLRLKSQLEKYRLIIPYISGRSEKLEARIERLMKHRDQSVNDLDRIQEDETKTARNSSVIEQKLLDMEVRKNSLIVKYNSLLSGHMPSGLQPTGDEFSFKNLQEEKQRFLQSVGGAFTEIENGMEELSIEVERLMEKQKRLAERKEKLDEKQAMVNKKLAAYRADIKDNLGELNNHLKNERELKSDFLRLIESLNQLPAVSDWAEKIYAELLVTSETEEVATEEVVIEEAAIQGMITEEAVVEEVATEEMVIEEAAIQGMITEKKTLEKPVAKEKNVVVKVMTLGEPLPKEE